VTNKASRARAILVALTSVFFFVTGCSTGFKAAPQSDTPDVTRTQEDIPEGPGLFTGEEGDLVFGRNLGKGKDKDKDKTSQPDAQQTQAQARQLEEQSKQFDKQIEELEHQRRELEALKEELKQILKTAPRPQ
jgi:hypothetical protein